MPMFNNLPLDSLKLSQLSLIAVVSTATPKVFYPQFLISACYNFSFYNIILGSVKDVIEL